MKHNHFNNNNPKKCSTLMDFFPQRSLLFICKTWFSEITECTIYLLLYHTSIIFNCLVQHIFYFDSEYIVRKGHKCGIRKLPITITLSDLNANINISYFKPKILEIIWKAMARNPQPSIQYLISLPGQPLLI